MYDNQLTNQLMEEVNNLFWKFFWNNFFDFLILDVFIIFYTVTVGYLTYRFWKFILPENKNYIKNRNNHKNNKYNIYQNNKNDNRSELEKFLDKR